ncbi:MAG: hypothetical protein WB802_02020 [Candidatus Dormiibacterota bacterium]|jgi:hypothetical protein
MAGRYIDFLVTGDPAAARATAEQALLARNFRVVWHDDWTATAERGSQLANALLGAFAQYFRVGVRLMSSDPGETTVRVEQQTIGMLGGAIGMSRVRKNMATLRTELEATFQAAGVLRGVSEA